jgi:predicted protein tyrosine phosphatase
MMKIVIRNYLAGSFLLEQQPNAWDAIVILDSGLSHTPFVAEQARKHIYLRFDDIVNENRGKRAPTSNDVRTAIEFASGSDHLMVCCRAGQSRSAAIAFVIGCQRLGTEPACELLDPKRHTPNSLIINLGATLIDSPLMLQAFAKWQTENKDVKLLNYVDDIEREFDELERQGAQNRIVTP